MDAMVGHGSLRPEHRLRSCSACIRLRHGERRSGQLPGATILGRRGRGGLRREHLAVLVAADMIGAPCG